MPNWIALQYVELDSDASTFPPPSQDCLYQAFGDTLPTVARFHIVNMVQGAWTAVRTKDTFLKSRYHRLAARRGKKRAIVAVAHSMLISAWHMLTFQQPYQELGGDYFDQRKKETKVSYMVRRLEKLTGGSVNIELQPAAA